MPDRSTGAVAREAPQAQQLSSLFLRLDPLWDDVCAGVLTQLIQANQQGHVCLPLPPGATRRRLLASPLCGRAGGYTPLIFDQERHLYFARHWFDEIRLAQGLLRLARQRQSLDAVRLNPWLRRLFPSGDQPDQQKVAAALALRQRLLVISGGPGTGKTTTVLSLLALMAAMSPQPLVMALAAPTGKAASRLSDAIRQASQRLPLDDELKSRLPTSAQTLHRLLGLRPGGASARFNAANPLPLDVLVVDEASMIDLNLMAQTIDALPPHARLILLGDRDQLASVEAGAVLGEICQQVAYSTETLAWLAEAGCTGLEGMASGAADCGLVDCIALLSHSHRFAADSGIGALSRQVNARDSDAALQLLQARKYADLDYNGVVDVEDFYRKRAPYWNLAWNPGDLNALQQQFVAFMPLVSERRQVEHLNREIEVRLERDGHKDAGQMWYAGRPVMISTNDYGLNLFNGDIGFALARPEGLRVAFPCADGRWREISPGRLPAHDTVYAMTVHKSQGSEFDEVCLVLPSSGGALLDRALVYTAVTRARRKFTVSGALDILAAAIDNAPQRHSGLARRLSMQ